MIWPAGWTLEMVERECCFQALKYTQGNKAAAARVLGINIKTFETKVGVFIEKPEADAPPANVKTPPIIPNEKKAKRTSGTKAQG